MYQALYVKTYLRFIIWPVLSLIIDEDSVLCDIWPGTEEIVVVTETDSEVRAEVEETVEHRAWSTTRRLRYVDDDRL